MKSRALEFVVGIFMVVGALALLALAVQVSGLKRFTNRDYYTVTAAFDNIGGLKERAPVSLAGVEVGYISGIHLDPKTLRAKVTMQIENQFNKIPVDSSASILTQGILGSNYIGIQPGFEMANLKNNDVIQTTHSALLLENLIGKLIYSVKGSGNNDKSNDQNNDVNNKPKNENSSENAHP